MAAGRSGRSRYGWRVGQLSFFSADLVPPQVADLGGLLAAHGQVSRSAGGSRLSILLAEKWRAEALLAELALREVDGELLPAADGAVLVRTPRTPALDALAASWIKGAVKAVPAGLVAEPGLLRCWTIAAGRDADGGYLLGLDPRAPDTYDPLGAVLARAGLAASLVGPRAGGPGLRIAGHRRRHHLVDLVGDAPADAPPGTFPRPEHGA